MDSTSPGISLYMNSCEALPITSLNKGGPGAAKEALACNLSVVSVDLGDLRQPVGNVDNCAVCHGDDSRAIALELIRVQKIRNVLASKPSLASLMNGFSSAR